MSTFHQAIERAGLAPRRLEVIELTEEVESPAERIARRGVEQALSDARAMIEFKITLLLHRGTPDALTRARGLHSALVEITLLEEKSRDIAEHSLRGAE